MRIGCHLLMFCNAVVTEFYYSSMKIIDCRFMYLSFWLYDDVNGIVFQSGLLVVVCNT